MSELEKVLTAILNVKDDDRKGVVVKLPFTLEARAKAALATAKKLRATKAAAAKRTKAKQRRKEKVWKARMDVGAS